MVKFLMFAERNRDTIAPYLRAIGLHIRNFVYRLDYSDTWTIRFCDHCVAYIPIPKAANSSIRYALLPLIGMQASDVEHIQAFAGYDKLRFSAAAASINEGWYVLTVVRNPYSRFVSAYLNKVRESRPVFRAFAAMGVTAGHSLESFASIVEGWPRPLLNDHLMPQSMLLSRALQLPQLKVYRVEELATDWEEVRAAISARTGLAIGPLGHANASAERENWRSHLTPRARRIINRIYADDFTTFGYPIED